MKTYTNLFAKITAFENLLYAAYDAARGKRERLYVMKFFLDLEENLFLLQESLRSKTYGPGTYHVTHIYHPKPRMISAAPFRDRVIHHALIRVIGPLLSKSLIYDVYSNRKNKGTHRAIRRCQFYLRRHDWVLKCDIRKYFPTIDHLLLKTLLRKKIADQDALWLLDQIIDGSNEQEQICDYYPGDDLFSPLERRRGLPLGNLTSQYLSDFFLDPLDHFVKEQLKVRGYLRYVDDFLLFGNSKQEMKYYRDRIVAFLENRRLRLNKARTQYFPFSNGVRFLGQVVYRSHRRLAGDNVRGFRKRLLSLQHVGNESARQSVAAWRGHALQADSQGLLRHLALADNPGFSYSH